MDLVIRCLAVYFFLLFAMRVSGRRTLADMTIFDFALVLIISESSQQAILGQDYSVTGGFLAIATLVVADIAMSYLKEYFPRVGNAIDGMPLLLVNNGEILEDRLKQERVGIDDILAAARKLQGIGNLEQVKYAVLERSGGITIIPRS